MRYFGHFIFLLVCLALEYGAIHALPLPWSLIPLCLSIGVFFVFTLHADLGLLWFVGVGFAADLQSMHPVGETVIGALIGGVLIYIVQQHISHSSLYSVMILGGSTSLVWLACAELLRRVTGVSSSFGFGMILTEASIAMILSGLLLLVVPRASKYLSRSIRFYT